MHITTVSTIIIIEKSFGHSVKNHLLSSQEKDLARFDGAAIIFRHFCMGRIRSVSSTHKKRMKINPTEREISFSIFIKEMNAVVWTKSENNDGKKYEILCRVERQTPYTNIKQPTHGISRTAIRV